MICYINKSKDPAFNLAFEEIVLKLPETKSILILWQNDNAIIVGRNQNIYEEVNIEKAEADSVHIIRRNTGGGAVFQDLGNLNFSIIQNRDEPSTYQAMLQPVINVLQKLNINACYSGKNDIKVDGQKISGNAQYIYKNRLLHHGTILFDVILSKIGNYLYIDKSKMKSKGVKSQRAMVTNVKTLLPEAKKDLTINDFRQLIIDEFQGNNITLEEITPTKIKIASALAKEKYRTWEWNYGIFPHFEYKNRYYFAGKGTVEIFAAIEKGIIKRIKFFGDFNGGITPVAVFEDKLINCPYHSRNLKKIITNDLVHNVFGFDFTFKEIVHLLMNLKQTPD